MPSEPPRLNAFIRSTEPSLGDQLVGVGGDDSEGPNPFARSGFFPVLPNAGDPKWRTIFHCDRIGLFRLLPFDRLPLEKTVHRHDATSFAVRIPEYRQVPHRLISVWAGL